jgi:hypothetical protein
MMGHGGKREGAGRKPALEPLEQFELGDWCECLWRKAQEDRTIAQYSAAPQMKELRRLQADALETHHRWAGQRVQGQSEKRQKVEDIEGWFEEHGTEGPQLIPGDFDPVRFARLRPISPKKQRPRIIAEVAAKFGKLTGKQVSQRAVRGCWDSYRQFQARARAEQG